MSILRAGHSAISEWHWNAANEAEPASEQSGKIKSPRKGNCHSPVNFAVLSICVANSTSSEQSSEIEMKPITPI